MTRNAENKTQPEIRSDSATVANGRTDSKLQEQNRMSDTSKKKCAALQFAKSATDDAILKKCVSVWYKRNVNADGSLKKNNYAPIYCVRDGVKLSVRRIGATLQLFKPGKSIPLPTAKTVWTAPDGVDLPADESADDDA